MPSDYVFALAVLFACLVAPVAVYAGEDAQSLAQLGGQMNSADKVLLEEQVAKNPGDVDSRTKLLGYYFIKGRRDADSKSNRLRHVMWFIENAPESEVLGLPYGGLNYVLERKGYDQAKDAWLRTLHGSPENLNVIRNASAFLLLHDPKISEELLLNLAY